MTTNGNGLSDVHNSADVRQMFSIFGEESNRWCGSNGSV